MRISNTFSVPLGIDEAWATLIDVERVAPCFPGAELTRVIDEKNFEGRVRVSVGPLSLSFAGSAEIVDRDDVAHIAVIRGKGADQKGRGSAQATVTLRARESGGETTINSEADISLAGGVAQYGRASGLIQTISDELLSEFAENLRAEIQGDGAETGSSGAPRGLSILSVLMRAVRRVLGGRKAIKR